MLYLSQLFVGLKFFDRRLPVSSYDTSTILLVNCLREQDWMEGGLTVSAFKMGSSDQDMAGRGRQVRKCSLISRRRRLHPFPDPDRIREHKALGRRLLQDQQNTYCFRACRGIFGFHLSFMMLLNE